MRSPFHRIVPAKKRTLGAATPLELVFLGGTSPKVGAGAPTLGWRPQSLWDCPERTLFAGGTGGQTSLRAAWWRFIRACAGCPNDFPRLSTFANGRGNVVPGLSSFAGGSFCRVSWLSTFGRSSLNVVPGPSTFGRSSLNVVSWLSTFGKPSLNVVSWLSTFGRSSLNVEEVVFSFAGGRNCRVWPVGQAIIAGGYASPGGASSTGSRQTLGFRPKRQDRSAARKLARRLLNITITVRPFGRCCWRRAGHRVMTSRAGVSRGACPWRGRQGGRIDERKHIYDRLD